MSPAKALGGTKLSALCDRSLAKTERKSEQQKEEHHQSNIWRVVFGKLQGTSVRPSEEQSTPPSRPQAQTVHASRHEAVVVVVERQTIVRWLELNLLEIEKS